MKILLLADHDNSNLSDQTAKALAAAIEIGGEIDILVAGHNCAAAGEQAARLSGIAKVLVADSGEYENMLAEPVTALLVKLAEGYDVIITAATTTGKNIMPRVAAIVPPGKA